MGPPVRAAMLDPPAKEHWGRHRSLWLRGCLDDAMVADPARCAHEVARWAEIPGEGMAFQAPGRAPHQDAPAYVDFGVEHHLTVMIPVDAFTRDNGCLEMARDASARRFLPQSPDGTLRPGVIEALELEPLLAVPGDIIVFDAWAPH